MGYIRTPPPGLEIERSFGKSNSATYRYSERHSLMKKDREVLQVQLKQSQGQEERKLERMQGPSQLSYRRKLALGIKGKKKERKCFKQRR